MSLSASREEGREKAETPLRSTGELKGETAGGPSGRFILRGRNWFGRRYRIEL